MVGLPFGYHSPMALCATEVQASSISCLQSSSLPPVPSGCLLTANHSPLPGSALQTPHPSTQPLSAAVATLSGWVGRAGVSTLSCCHRLLPCSLPTENEAPLLPQLSSHPVPVTGFPGCQPLLSSVPPLGLEVPYCLFHFLLLSFVLPG